jgi:hypothetical protein
MYTGYRIRDNHIYNEEAKTSFTLDNNHICTRPDQPTGCYLTDSFSEEVKHIYGPAGYTKFYVQCEHIYGPSTHLPWFDLCDDPA